MVSARHKKGLATLGVLATAALVAVAAYPIRDAVRFARLSPTERKLVREWKAYTICGVVTFTVRPDHTWTATGTDDDSPPLHGHWRVEGDDILSEVDPGQFQVLPLPPPSRAPMSELVEADRIVRSIERPGRK